MAGRVVFVHAQVDPHHRVAECDETNNVNQSEEAVQCVVPD